MRFPVKAAALIAPLIGAVAVLAAHAVSPAAAADDRVAPFDQAQTRAVETIVRDYLLAHPEVIVEAVQKLQDKMSADQDAKIRDNLTRVRKDLEQDPATPVLGNPKGDVTITEFFDYRCGYCKMVYRTLMKVVAEDGKVRLVLKDYPVLGPDSVEAARASLAAHAQGKYAEFHAEGMAHRGGFDDAALTGIAKRIGLDMDRFAKDRASADTEKALDRNQVLGRALDLSGTPAFIIGDEVVPGAINDKSLRELIAKVRSGKAN